MPQPLRVSVRMSFAEKSELYWIFTRRKREGERDADVLRRMVIRYNQMLQNSSMPDPNGVMVLSQLLSQNSIDLMFQSEYPKRSDVSKVIEAAAIPEEDRRKLTIWIEEMTYGDYCKLIEAVENYYNGR